MKRKRVIAPAIALTAAVLIGATAVSGQQALPSPNLRADSEQTPPAQLQTPALTTSAYLTPIHGIQGVFAQTLDGATIAAQSVEDKFNPASSIKLATALAALKAFGPEYRFATSIWATGKIDAATGNLNGDLIITGRDPSLHYEHAVMLARQLNQMGIRTVSGNLVFAPGFTMNFNWSSQRSGEEFRDALDVARRSANATRSWIDERTLVGDTQS